MATESTSEVFAHPEEVSLEVKAAKSGMPTLRVHTPNGKATAVHSAYDPEREADDFLAAHREEIEKADLIVLFGLGMGYHVERIVRILSEEQSLVVGDASTKIAKTLKESRNTFLFEHPKVAIYAGSEPQAFRMVVARSYNLMRHDKVVLLDHPGSCRVFPEVYRQFRDEVRSVLTTNLTNLVTRIQWNTTWIRNGLENLDFLVRAPGVNALYDRFDHVPGIVVAAGPSLAKNVSQLRKAKEKALIAAVGTSLRPLLKEGIEPDLVVAIDGGEANGRLFEGLPYGEIPLVLEPMVYPSIPHGHQGLKFVGHTQDALATWLAPVIGEKGEFGGGGSVACSAFDLLRKFGCDPIILVGQDLAYTDGRTHSEGTLYEDRRVDPEKEGNLITIQGIDGSPMPTSKALYSFLQWFEQQVFHLQGKRRIIDATEGGAYIEGTELSTLRDAVARHCTNSVNGGAFLRKAYEAFVPPDRQEVTSFVQDAVRHLDDIMEFSRRGMRLSEKLSDQAVRGELGSSAMSKTIRALDRIDAKLKEKEDHFVLLRDGLYPAAIGVLKNLDGRPPKDETEQARAKRIAEQSLTLYTGLYDRARELKSYIPANEA